MCQCCRGPLVTRRKKTWSNPSTTIDRSGSKFCGLCDRLINPGGRGQHRTPGRREDLYPRTSYEERLRAAKALHRNLRGFNPGWGHSRPKAIPADLIDRYRAEE